MTATVGIDPRIRDRRIAVARDVGHRRLRRLQSLGAVVGGLAMAFVISRSPLLDVDRVDVSGEGADVAAVRAALEADTGRAMATVDTQAMADAVAAVPGVASATVRRSWPDTISVDVVASAPAIAARSADGGWVIADGEGAVLAISEDLPAGLVVAADLVLSAAPGQVFPSDHASLVAVAAALPDDLVWRVGDLVAVDEATVHARLVDGGVVAFTTSSDLGAAGVAASSVAATVPPGCVDRIDVTSAQAPVLVRADTC